MPLRTTTAALALALCACSLVHERVGEGGPASRPAKAPGMLVFTVGSLSFEAPASWRASGDAAHVLLVSPADDARIDVQRGARFGSDAECLSQGEASLKRGAVKLEKARRHPTTLAGRRAVVQEADQGGWHGWAWAVCDGGEQYRLFFTGRSPMKEEALAASRRLPASTVFAARPVS